MPLDNLLSLLLGIVFTIGGVAFIVFRTRVVAFYNAIYRGVNTLLTDEVARSTTPRTFVAVGIVFVLIGVGSLLMAALRRDW